MRGEQPHSQKYSFGASPALHAWTKQILFGGFCFIKNKKFKNKLSKNKNLF